MTTLPTLIEANNLVKSFGDFTAVNDISLSVKKGEILGFLGPNGAGKTTTMKMLTGFLKPTSGSISICGEDLQTSGAALRTKIGYLPEGAPLYPEMTVSEYLYFIAECHNITGSVAKDVIDSAVAAVNLQDVVHQTVDKLSKGFKRRVGLAGAILHAPDVLILDEPTDGLDPNQKHEVRQLITAMALERAIIISTHILEEVEALCTRAVIINQGKMVADVLPSQLKAMSKYNNAVTMLVDMSQAEQIAARLNMMRAIDSIDAIKEGDQMRLTVLAVDQQEIASRIADMASISGWPVSQFTVENGRLDDVFRTLTTRDPDMVIAAVEAYKEKHKQDRPYEY